VSWRALEFKAELRSPEAMVDWLAGLLAARGVKVLSAKETDWGLELTVRVGSRKTLLGIGRLEGSRRTYRAFTRPPQVLDHLLGFGRVRAREAVLKALEEALRADGHRPRWVEIG